jgi:peptidoglycan/LPS O-acetylase OafA/YrhL
MASQQDRHIVGLDLIRFVSAAMVMFFHLAFWASVSDSTVARLIPNLPSFPKLAPVAWVGWVGVEIFFVLSGLVIPYSAEGASAYAFFRNRFLRLMPAVWICASLTLVVLLGGGFLPLNQLIRRYLKTVVLIPKAPWIDPVYWSLSVEVFFYGFILCLLLSNRFRRIESFMGAIGITSALIWIMFGISLVSSGRFSLPLLNVLHYLQDSWTLQVLLLHHGCQFALGVYLWLLLFKGFTARRMIIATLCFIGGFLETVWTAGVIIPDGQTGFPTGVPSAIWAVVVLLIICSVLLNTRVHAWAGSRVGTIRTLGLMTYPLYLLHQIIGNALRFIFHQEGMSPGAALACAIAACLSASLIIATTLEPRLKTQLQRVFAAMEAWLRHEPRNAHHLRTTSPAAS